jgi:hypothetical protein
MGEFIVTILIRLVLYIIYAALIISPPLLLTFWSCWHGHGSTTLCSQGSSTSMALVAIALVGVLFLSSVTLLWDDILLRSNAQGFWWLCLLKSRWRETYPTTCELWKLAEVVSYRHCQNLLSVSSRGLATIVCHIWVCWRWIVGWPRSAASDAESRALWWNWGVSVRSWFYTRSGKIIVFPSPGSLGLLWEGHMW